MNVFKRFISKSKTEVVKDRNGNSFEIPVNASGYVPKSALVKRQKEMQTPKGIARDNKIVSHKLYKSRLTPEEALPYWKNPNKCDVEGIDAPETVKTKPKRAAKYSNEWEDNIYNKYSEEEAEHILAAEMKDAYYEMMYDDTANEEAVSYLKDVRYDEKVSNKHNTAWRKAGKAANRAYANEMYANMKAEELYSYNKKKKLSLKSFSKKIFRKPRLDDGDWQGLWNQIAKESPELQNAVRDRSITDWVKDSYDYWTFLQMEMSWQECYENDSFKMIVAELCGLSGKFDSFDYLIFSVNDSADDSYFDRNAFDLMIREYRILRKYNVEIPKKMEDQYKRLKKKYKR